MLCLPSNPTKCAAGLPPPHFVMSLLFPTAPLALIADACVELMEASQKIFTPDLKPLPYLDVRCVWGGGWKGVGWC